MILRILTSLDFEEADETHSNDPNSLDRSRSQLQQTYSRSQPIEHKVAALVSHAGDVWEAEIQHLKSSIPTKEFEQTCTMLGPPFKYSSRKRKRSRKEKQEATEVPNQHVTEQDNIEVNPAQQPWVHDSPGQQGLALESYRSADAITRTMQDYQTPFASDQATNSWSTPNFFSSDFSSEWQHVHATPQFQCFDSTYTSYQPTSSLAYDPRFCATLNSTYLSPMSESSDTLHQVHPNISPLPSTRYTDTREGLPPNEGHKPLLPWETENMPQQSASYHGTFNQDLLGLQSVPSLKDSPVGGGVEPLFLEDFDNPLGYPDMGAS
ncbi:hypothetical protein N0V90_010914 [Kalmusia sp. IMI 367209]|nr:hypothetical protein N0V90_010914 [Kalmusia sp. IMI 367209]